MNASIFSAHSTRGASAANSLFSGDQRPINEGHVQRAFIAQIDHSHRFGHMLINNSVMNIIKINELQLFD